METETPESRTYVVGLPVIVVVSPEGFVSVEVDTSELGAAVRDDTETEHTTEQVDADADLLDKWAEHHAVINQGWVK